MKTLTKVLLFAAGSSLALLPALRAEATNNSTPADAGRPRFQQMREHRMQRLDANLHLTADQKAKIQEIWNATAAQGKALRAEKAAASQEVRAKRREMMLATRQQVRALLTPEQQKIFDEMPQHGPRPAPVAGDAEGR